MDAKIDGSKRREAAGKRTSIEVEVNADGGYSWWILIVLTPIGCWGISLQLNSEEHSSLPLH